ncbi:MAG: hypothetical protein ACI81P_003004 [Neolewinella sp.]|jgi:hypothetical protein
MLSPESKKASKLGEKPQLPVPKEPEGDRLRDIIVVFITYPLTPTKRAEKLVEKKPWLEFLSLLLKVALAAYALYEGVMGG